MPAPKVGSTAIERLLEREWESPMDRLVLLGGHQWTGADDYPTRRWVADPTSPQDLLGHASQPSPGIVPAAGPLSAGSDRRSPSLSRLAARCRRRWASSGALIGLWATISRPWPWVAKSSAFFG